jgi:cell division protein FtsB
MPVPPPVSLVARLQADLKAANYELKETRAALKASNEQLSRSNAAVAKLKADKDIKQGMIDAYMERERLDAQIRRLRTKD